MPIFSAGSASVSIVPDFSGAQKAIGEFFARQSDIKVKVTPDLAGADVARTEAELNAMRGTAKVEVDRNLLTSSITTALAEAFSRSGLDKLGSVLSAAIKPTVITAAAGAFTELAAVASQAVGAVALLPAGIAALAAPVATLAIGFHGVGTALTDAFDPKKAAQFQAAMDKLAPSAQQFVQQIVALKPAWDNLRLDVQQNLLNGVGAAVGNLANVALPILHTGLTGIASALNEGLLATMTALQGQGANFATLFTNIAGSLRIAAGAAAPLVQAFGTLGAVGSQFLPVLAQGFVNVATAFNNWVQRIADSGQLVVIIQNAIDVIKQLGALAVNVAGVMSGIFTAALPYGTILLDLLIRTTGALSTFIHSADGQAALGSFFSGLTVALGTLLPALTVLAQAVVVNVLPAIGQFAAALAPIAGTLLVQLASVLNQVGQILPPIATVFAALFSAMAPLIPVIGTLITTLLPPLVQFFGQLAPIIGQVATILGGALLQAAAAIAPILPQLGDAFIKILNALLPLVPPLLQVALQLLPPLLSVVSALVPVVQGLVTVFAPLIQTFLKIVDATVLPFLVGLINDFAAGLKVLAGFLGPLAPILQAIAVAVGVWTAAQWLLNIAMDANPIGIIILAIGALITVIGLIATHLDEIKAVWLTVWGAISDFFTTVWNAIKTVAETVWNSISSFFVGAWNELVGVWNAIWTGVRDFFTTIWDAISSFAQTVWNAIAGFFTNAWNAFTAAWTNFWNAIFSFFQNLWNTLVSWIEGVWNALVAFFTNAWNNFTAAWTNFWNAIFSFFQNLWNTLVSWVQNLWNSLASWFAGVWNAFTGAWNNFWNAILSFFQGVWNTLTGWIKTAWNNIADFFTGALNSFVQTWQGVWQGVSDFFGRIWNGIKSFAQTVWEDIKKIIAAPINFVIGTILNHGLFAAWNAVNDFLHLPWHINDLPLVSFATGGYTGDTGVFGTGDREDPAGIVHAREFVFTANQVANAGGPDAMYAMASQLDSGFAMGGLVRQQAGDPQAHLNSYVVPPTIAPRVQHFLDALSAGQAEAVQATGGFDALGPGFYYGGFADPISAGKAFAAAQSGKPYIWGGVGPAGYDCSGFQSAITNVLRGSTSPYSRVGSTANFPWSGFTSGLTSAYAIGATKDAGGGVGHMAGTLAGINAEAGGAHDNVAFGGPAAGATASLFNIHASLPQVGGQFVPGFAGASTSAVAPVISVGGNIFTSALDVLKHLTDVVTGGVTNLTSQPQGGKFLQILAGVPKTLLGGLWGIVKSAIESFFAAVASPSSNTPTTSAGLLDQAMGIAQAMYGWGSAADRTATNYIVSNESGWNPKAQNPTSTASGLWQQIDSTWIANRPIGETAAHMKDAQASSQDHAGFKYVHDRYGTLPAAQAYWAAHHYYDQGGWLPPGHSTIYNGTGQFEAVLNAAQQTALSHAITTRPDGGDTLVEVYIGNDKLDGHIDRRISHQQSQDARTIRSYR